MLFGNMRSSTSKATKLPEAALSTKDLDENFAFGSAHFLGMRSVSQSCIKKR